MEEEAVKQQSAVSRQQSAVKINTPVPSIKRGLRSAPPLWKRGAGLPLLRSIATGSGDCLILFVLIFSLVSFVHAATTDDMVNDIQKKLSAINDLNGTFSQTSYLKDLEKTEKYAGTFYIKKPHAIMWEYKAPRDEKVFINNTDTWIYKKSRKQAIKTIFSKEAYGQIPIALLNSLDNIKVDFDISNAEQGHLNLKPKKQMGTIREIIVETGSGSFPVKSLSAIDQYGNIIMIELGDIKINSSLEDSIFIFNPRPGVEVFDMTR